ncbi:odorant receptor 131-2-like [Ranitomeya variabilis]|uniref:odorant receptor 131-2-like n=1 Tax=Ranitomeya variabilis TaxID=490064 RepID=UPI00405763F1
MVNFTSISGNGTLMSTYIRRVDAVTRSALAVFTFLMFTFFLYIISGLLKVFFSNPQIWEKSRYILFVHMLINDTLYLALGDFFLVTAMYSVHFPVSVCFMLHTLATCCFRVTPYNLAVMSLERFIAICFPLRHLHFCTAKRTRYVILVIWLIGVCPSIADCTVIIYTIKGSFFSLHGFCGRSMLFNVIMSFINILSFAAVALIIAFTYIEVMLVARKIGSGGSSAHKAGKTVMLHAFQLILCMVSFISIITEVLLINYVSYLLITNYIILTCLPRLLSPVIYGLRDEVFRKYIKKMNLIKC